VICLAQVQQVNMSALTGATVATAGNITAFASSATRQFDYRGTDNNIYGFYSYGSGLKWQNISALAGFGPDAAGDPVMTYTSVPQNVVVYRSNDNHIHWMMAQNGWRHLDVSGAVGAPTAVGQPALYASSVVQNIDYRGTNGHIYELYNYTPTSTTTWHYQDLTSSIQGGAPLASGDPATAYTSLPENVVVYVDTNGHIQQLSAHNGVWTNQDLTVASSCYNAPVGTTPALYASTTLKLIVYAATNERLVQMTASGGFWSCEDISSKYNPINPPSFSGVPTLVYVNGLEYIRFTNTNLMLYQTSGGSWTGFGVNLWGAVAVWNTNNWMSTGIVDINHNVYLNYTGKSPF
jgi:hypothetical protein